MGKNNGLITVIIVVLALLVGLLGGYVLKDVLSNNNSEIGTNENNNPGENNNNDNKNNEANFTLDDAEKLMDKYAYEDYGGSEKYITSLSDESINAVVVHQTEASKIATCEEYYQLLPDEERRKGEMFYSFYDGYDLLATAKIHIYSYEKLLNTKKELFGPVSILKKGMVPAGIYHLYYLEELNSYGRMYAGMGYENKIVKDVVSVDKTNNKLQIIAKNIITDPENNTVTEQHEYIFEETDGKYYLVAIN